MGVEYDSPAKVGWVAYMTTSVPRPILNNAGGGVADELSPRDCEVAKWLDNQSPNTVEPQVQILPTGCHNNLRRYEMKKSKEFRLSRSKDLDIVYLEYVNGKIARTFCYIAWRRAFGIKLKKGETKRVRITIEEI